MVLSKLSKHGQWAMFGAIVVFTVTVAIAVAALFLSVVSK